ncbi:MAG TPA: M90 family metallopeptidase [Candidatus Krumholzibacteria bacterium]|nr:M90 family metallopeptidase [Candidatus Krumholzibacteria bacterium]
MTTKGADLFGFLKHKRRARLRDQPVPSQWPRILEANVPVYRRVPQALRTQLHGHMHVFLAEKHFEGCDGLEMTDEIRVTVAAQACLLILDREANYYPDLVTILVYPSVFYADVEEPDGAIVSEYKEDRSGESWDLGVVILSWEDVVEYASTGRAGYNVVLHEFAHQLDMENGAMDGMPKLQGPAQRTEWARVFSQAYESFEQAASSNRGTLIDSYGAGDPAEFFAVVTESFFERPLALKREYAALYDTLAHYYRVDPASWEPPGSVAAEWAAPRRARGRRRRRG